jgi:hypothetical protein
VDEIYIEPEDNQMTRNYTEDEIKTVYKRIDTYSHLQMAIMFRFSRVGHPYFDSQLPFYEYFMKRFKELGGMTPEISKEIGWD